MPIDYSKYPAEWHAISKRIRFKRAGNRCEWCGAENYKPHPKTGSKVILTVAHLGTPYPDGSPGDKTDKHDVRDENLAALCQKCHLAYDADEHAASRAAKRREKREASGQMVLPGFSENHLSEGGDA